MDKTNGEKKDEAPKKPEGNSIEDDLRKKLNLESKGSKESSSKEAPPTSDIAKSSSSATDPTADSGDSEKYILDPAKALKPETVRKCLTEITKVKESILVVANYNELEEKLLAALPDAGFAHSVIISVQSQEHYLLFEVQKPKLTVYNSQKGKINSSEMLKRVTDLLEKKGLGKLTVQEADVVQQAPNSNDSGLFIVIYVYNNIVRGVQNYKVSNTETMRTNLYEFLNTKDTKRLENMVVPESKPIAKTPESAPPPIIPKTNITNTMPLPQAAGSAVAGKINKPSVKESTGFITPSPGANVPKTNTTSTIPTLRLPAKPGTCEVSCPLKFIITNLLISAFQSTPTMPPATSQVPLWVPPSPTQSAASEGSFSYSLPGSPSTPNGLMKYRRYLKKYRKMAREDDEGVQYVWTKYRIDDETIRRERRSCAENTRYPPRRGRRRMVLMEIDSEVTWDLMIRCKFCAKTFARAADCKEHLINQHNLERN